MNESPVALVTGSRGGLGAAIAVELARRGYRLVAASHKSGDAKETVESIRAAGGEAIAAAGDLADADVPERLVAEAQSAFGRLDLLVNNAAWRELGPSRRASLESWQRTLAIGLTAPWLLARAAAAAMTPRGRGVIVNVSSIQSKLVNGFIPAYAASKGGLESLTRDLAAEFGPSGIRVLAVAPGAIAGGFSDTTAANAALRDFSEEMIMLRRWAMPEEIARSVAAVASDDFSYLTGTTLVIDGGWTAQHLPHSLKARLFPDDFA